MSYLYNPSGKRKYLTIGERRAFILAASRYSPEIRMFCETLAYTGARISEILNLTPVNIDFDEQIISIECLKKRRAGVYRFVPAPSELLNTLDEAFMLRAKQGSSSEEHQRIWPWCRTTAWKHVKAAMIYANIDPARAHARALRHSLAVNAIQVDVPINVVQKWLGHSRLATTALYADVVGQEERKMAKQFWNTF